MTRAEAVSEWRMFFLPSVRAYERDGCPDWPARRESWGVYIDALCRDRRITTRQYDTWGTPAECGR